MISMSKTKLKTFSKIVLFALLIYVLGFIIVKSATYYQTLVKKEQLEKDLRNKKIEFKKLKNDVKKVKEKTQNIENSYISQEELEKKVSKIFERMSILDYNLRYLNSKKMCIDRYIIIAQLTARSEKGIEAGEGILSYLGKVKKSQSNDTLYYVDYIAKPKDKK